MNTWQTLALYMTVGGLAILFMFFAQSSRKKAPFALQIFSRKILIKKSSIFLFLSFLTLFLLLAFRGASVGSDYNVYKQAYYGIRDGTLTEQQESWLGVGFKMVASAFSGLGIGFVPFLILVGFFTLLFVYITIWRESDSPVLSLAVFLATCLFYQMFNQFRQMLAIVLVFYSIRFIMNKNIWKFLVVILIAASMHVSALVFLPMYFIGRIKINKNISIIYVLLSIVVFFGYDLIAQLLANTYYGATYFGSGYDIAARTSVILNTVFRIVLLAVCLPFYEKMDKINPKNRVLFHMLIVCVIVQLLTVRSYVFGRISTYFFVSVILLVPNIITNLFPKNKMIMTVFIITLLSYHTFYFLSDNAVESGYRYYTTVFMENDGALDD